MKKIDGHEGVDDKTQIYNDMSKMENRWTFKNNINNRFVGLSISKRMIIISHIMMMCQVPCNR